MSSVSILGLTRVFAADFGRSQEKYQYRMVGHSGTGPEERLAEWGKPPLTAACLSLFRAFFPHFSFFSHFPDMFGIFPDFSEWFLHYIILLWFGFLESHKSCSRALRWSISSSLWCSKQNLHWPFPTALNKTKLFPATATITAFTHVYLQAWQHRTSSAWKSLRPWRCLARIWHRPCFPKPKTALSIARHMPNFATRETTP